MGYSIRIRMGDNNKDDNYNNDNYNDINNNYIL